MNRIHALLMASVCAAPLLVHAQTSNAPGGSASTGSPLEQSKSSPVNSTPSNTSTAPTTTNPSGSLTKGAVKGSDHSTNAKGGEAMSKTKPTKGNDVAPGDVPTYPAPTKDGTPTK